MTELLLNLRFLVNICGTTSRMLSNKKIKTLNPGIVYSLRFDSVEIYLWAECMLSPISIHRGKHYALNRFDCLIVCPFLGKVRQVLF